MIKNERKSTNILGTLLGLLILAVLIAGAIVLFTPFGKPIQFAYKQATTNSSYNFKGLTDSDQPDTKTAKLDTPCNVNVKYSTKLFKDPSITQVPTTNIAGTGMLKLNSIDTKDSSELSISCNRVVDQVEAIKNYIITSWTTKPEFEKQFGKSLEEVKSLSRVEFFKQFTSKTNPACSIKDDLDRQLFINPSLTSRFSKSYTYCNTTAPTQNVSDYYLFPNDESDVILVIRTTNPTFFKSELLLF
jgi:hypothetical protein